jgi:hypothetical protein
VKMLHQRVEKAQVKINSFFVGTPPFSFGVVPLASARMVTFFDRDLPSSPIPTCETDLTDCWYHIS